MNQDEVKRLLGIKAADYIDPWLQADVYIGVGTGSTANHFIDALAGVQHRFAGAVASSVASADRLKSHGIRVVELNEVSSLAVYVDGADEINPAFSMIKGGGAALTREKIVASAADQFVCIADRSKWVEQLGAFPCPSKSFRWRGHWSRESWSAWAARPCSAKTPEPIMAMKY